MLVFCRGEWMNRPSSYNQSSLPRLRRQFRCVGTLPSLLPLPSMEPLRSGSFLLPIRVPFPSRETGHWFSIFAETSGWAFLIRPLAPAIVKAPVSVGYRYLTFTHFQDLTWEPLWSNSFFLHSFYLLIFHLQAEKANKVHSLTSAKIEHRYPHSRLGHGNKNVERMN